MLLLQPPLSPLERTYFMDDPQELVKYFFGFFSEVSFTIIHHNAFPDLCYDEIIPDVKFKNLSINEFIFS